MTKQIPFRFGGKGLVLCSRNKKTANIIVCCFDNGDRKNVSFWKKSHSDIQSFHHGLGDFFPFFVNFFVFKGFIQGLECQTERKVAFIAVLWNIKVTQFRSREEFAFALANCVKDGFHRHFLRTNEGHVAAHGGINR